MTQFYVKKQRKLKAIFYTGYNKKEAESFITDKVTTVTFDRNHELHIYQWGRLLRKVPPHRYVIINNANEFWIYSAAAFNRFFEPWKGETSLDIATIFRKLVSEGGRAYRASFPSQYVVYDELNHKFIMFFDGKEIQLNFVAQDFLVDDWVWESILPEIA